MATCPVWLFVVAAMLASTTIAKEGEWKAASALPLFPGVQSVRVKVLKATDDSQEVVYAMPSPQVVEARTLKGRTLAPAKHKLVMGNAPLRGDPGKPVLPVIPCRLVIPSQHEIDRVVVSFGQKKEIEGSYNLENGQTPYPLIPGVQPEITEPDVAVYDSDDVFPSQRYEVVGVQNKRGVSTVYIRLYPAEYRPQSGRISYYEEMTVQVFTQPAKTRREAVRIKYRPALCPISEKVDNPSTLNSYPEDPADKSSTQDFSLSERRSIESQESSGPAPMFTPPTLPCNPSDTFGYVVVTRTALRPAITNYIAYKQSRGLTATIVTMDDILGFSLYTSGSADDAETLRNFIIDAYTDWETDFVLLAGDTNIVPMRALWCESWSGGYTDNIPSDVYFQCLDGDFNYDGDSNWGEPTDGIGGGDVDLEAEVYIGRASAENAEEMANFVYKVLSYEKESPTAGYVTNALMLGEYLGFGGVSDYAKNSMEEIRLGSTNHGYTTKGFASTNIFGVDTLYDADVGEWSEDTLKALINSNLYSIINHLGHCNYNYWARLENDDADSFINTNYLFAYSQGCIPGAFDKDCIAEHLTTSTTNGMFGVVFNSRYGWGSYNSTDGPSQRFNRQFWDSYFGENEPRPGMMNAYAHEQNLWDINGTCIRWCFYESNLLGDPEMRLHGLEPRSSLELDRLAYRSNAKVGVRVYDEGVSTNETSVPVDFVTSNAVDGVRWNATVTNARMGTTVYFTNSVALTSGVTAVEGDSLIVTYVDASTNLLTRTVLIDDTPPVITNAQIMSMRGDESDVRWYTDEPADSFVIAGTNLPLAGKEAQGASTYSTTYEVISGQTQYIHEVTVTGLVSFSTYYVAVLSADYAGNSNSAPADLSSTDANDYLKIIAQDRCNAYEDDMNNAEFSWTATNVAGALCWEYGIPTYGPSAPHTGEKCWGTVLNGRYPALANAWIESEVIHVENSPRLTFHAWYDIEQGINDYRDAGFIEINDGSGWHNVTSDSDITAGNYLHGDSAGWQLVTVNLSLFTNKAIQIRFRLETDGGDTAAGWYIDDVVITHVKEPGIFLSSYSIDDASGGDGDGCPEPGETFTLNLRVFNSHDENTYTNVVGSVGSPTEGITFLGGETVSVDYGNLMSGDFAYSGTQIVMSVAANVATGTVASIFQSVTATNGGAWEHVLDLEIVDRVTISGTVTNLFPPPAAIQGATVHGEVPGVTNFSATTDISGNYNLHGCLKGVSHSVWAGKPGEYSPSDATNVMATGIVVSGIDFGLGKAYAGYSPSNILFTVSQGKSVSTNLHLDNTAGNIPFIFEFSNSGSASNWLSVLPASGSLAAGSSTNILLSVNAANLSAGMVSTTLYLAGNDIGGATIQIPISVQVDAAPVLDISAVNVVSDSDGDGHIEQGETVLLYITLINNGAVSTGTNVTGVLSSKTNAVTVTTTNAIAWPDISAYGGEETSVTNFTIEVGSVADGTPLWFGLAVTNGGGEQWDLEFALTSTVRYAIGGTVTYYTNTTIGVSGVQIKITGPTNSYSTTTDSQGDYLIKGFLPGNYKVLAIPPLPYVSPSITNINLVTDMTNVDFQVALGGITVSPVSITKTLDEYRQAVTNIRLHNTGSTDCHVTLEVKHKQGISQGEVGSLTIPTIDWAALDPETYAPQRLIVRFKNGVAAQQRMTVLDAKDLNIIKEFHAIPVAVVEFSPGLSPAEVAEQLLADPAVLYVEPDYRITLDAMPDDPFFGEMYGLHNTRQTGGTRGADIRATNAWAITTGETNVVVAVVDTGADITHDDLADNIVPGWNFGADSSDVSDLNGHGTHVAGTIAAVGNNATGIVGVAWNTKIMPLCVYGWATGWVSAAVGALEYAVDNGAKVSNHSWGTTHFSTPLYEMIQYAYSNEHVLVCSAGNSGVDNDLYPHYPSSYNLPNIIAVAATDHDDQLAYFTCYGAESVDIAAPGVDILSLVPEGGTPGTEHLGGGYTTMSGTSMSAPHVSGVIALLRSVAPWATVDMICQAVLDGARYDPVLEGKMSTAGHLDAVGALEIIRAFWLELSQDSGDIPGSSDLIVQVTLNAGGKLTAGDYEAEILIKQGNNITNVPVTLTISPAPVPVYVGIRIDDSSGGDGDGYAEPGEVIDLYVCLHNDGSAIFLSPTGVLSTTVPTGVTITDSSIAWSSMASGDQAFSTDPAQVSFGASVTNLVAFTLTVHDATHAPWTNSFLLPVEEKNSITGFVRNSSGQGVSNAVIEYWGSMSGTTFTDTNGDYRIDGLTNGTFKVRAILDLYEKKGPITNMLASTDGIANFVVFQPDINFSTNRVAVSVPWRCSTSTNVVITNASTNAFSFECLEMPRRKVALISDDHQLTDVKPVLEAMGSEVTSWTDNYEVVSIDQGGGQSIFLSRTYYSSDDALVFSNDLVIADLSGENGAGRLLLAEEQDVFERYLERGGKLIITGVNPMSQPDNSLLLDIVGIESNGMNRACASSSNATLVTTLKETMFVDVSVGDVLYDAEATYDLATPDTSQNVNVYFKCGDATKLMKKQTADGGVTYYWAGNNSGTNWSVRGIWQDVLKNILIEELQTNVSWLSVSCTNTQISGESVPVVLSFNNASNLNSGTYKATLIVKGNYPGAENRYIQISLNVELPTLNAISSTGVTNWMGQPIQGDGSEDSCVFQVVWAGNDGRINLPQADGKIAGDDVILAVYPTGKEYSRFGKGYERSPDYGLFSEIFYHNLQTGAVTRFVYVRAWDGASFASSVAYGDSELYELTLKAGESHDFGSWIVNQVIGYPDVFGGARDSNNDSVPDGWYVLNGMNPRTPVGGLTASGSVVSTFGSYGTGTNQFKYPGKLFVSGNLIFVLDKGNNAVKVWNRVAEQFITNYTYSFSQPEGMGKDPRTNRFAVADTGNHRIQIFTFDAITAQITHERSFGSYGTTGDGELNSPNGVAIGPLGRVYVADTGNNRVQVFSETGGYLSKFGSPGALSGEFSQPRGICVDSSGLIYVADTGNYRIQIFNGSGSFLWKFGSSGSGNGQFDEPRDVQIGFDERIFVADTKNDRIQVFDSSRNHLVSIGSSGSDPGELWFPYGVAPVSNSRDVYVADTYNHRVQMFETIIDVDQDGMDDTWEELHGLNPSVNDALSDPDCDGVINIGEYRVGTDPQKTDTDNDGLTDHYELAAGSDPRSAQYDLFQITKFSGTTDFVVTFMAESNRVYQIQSNTNLLETSGWAIEPGSVVTAGMNGIITYTNTPSVSDTIRFYRAVRVGE